MSFGLTIAAISRLLMPRRSAWRGLSGAGALQPHGVDLTRVNARDPSQHRGRLPRRPCFLWRAALFAGVWAVLATASALPARAHPHVFVTTRETVLFAPDGRVTGIRHDWAFDEFYSSFLVQGLDKGPDGRYSRETLAELAKTNTEGLTDVKYFTFIKANGKALTFNPPQDYWLEDGGKHLTLHFTLPLAEPVKPSKAFVMRIYDPTYFVAFNADGGPDAVKLEGQAPGCTLLVRKPPANDTLKQSLARLDVTQQPELEDAGAAFADSILVACP